MLEQTFAPLRPQRLHREVLVAPVEKEPTQVIYISARHGNYALPKGETTPHNGAAEYLWLPSKGDPLPKNGKATDSSATDPLKKSARHNINGVIAELEKQRARLFAQTRAAEARARVAERKFEQSENRLEQETNQRLMAEATARAAEEKAQKIEALLGANPATTKPRQETWCSDFLFMKTRCRRPNRRRNVNRRKRTLNLQCGERVSSHRPIC